MSDVDLPIVTDCEQPEILPEQQPPPPREPSPHLAHYARSTESRNRSMAHCRDTAPSLDHGLWRIQRGLGTVRCHEAMCPVAHPSECKRFGRWTGDSTCDYFNDILEARREQLMNLPQVQNNDVIVVESLLIAITMRDVAVMMLSQTGGLPGAIAQKKIAKASWDYLERANNQVLKFCQKIGLDPLSRVLLGLNTARGMTELERLEEEKRIRKARELRVAARTVDSTAVETVGEGSVPA